MSEIKNTVFCPNCISKTTMKNSFIQEYGENKFRIGNCGFCGNMVSRIEEKINLGTNWNLFINANTSAAAGLPISFVLNITFLPFFASWFITGNPTDTTIGALLVAIPFYWASVFRMFTINWAWVRYQIDINPLNLFRKLFKRLLR